MARSITKTFGGIRTSFEVVTIDDGKPKVESYYLDGNKSEKACTVAMRKLLKTSNFIVRKREVVESDEAITYTMGADTFLAYADECKTGETYGHDTVTATMKLTLVVYYDAELEEHTFVYNGVTTESKLLKAARNFAKSEQIVIAYTKVFDARYWMSKTDFIKYATIVSKNEDDSGEDSESANEGEVES